MKLCSLSSSSLDLLRVCFVGGRILSLIQWNRLPDWDKIYDFMIIVQHLLMTKIKIKLLERVPDVFVTLFSIQFDQTVCLYSPHLPLLPHGCVCVGIKGKLLISRTCARSRFVGLGSCNLSRHLHCGSIAHKWTIFKCNG